MESEKKSRLLALDALRGLAALAVVAFHYGIRFEELYGHPIPISATLATALFVGQYGVHLFFMISGFVIFMSLERTRSWKDFVVSRFSRLYPAYWVAVLLTFGVISIVGLPDKHYSVLQLLANLTMFQMWLRVKNIDGVYWTLAIEMIFYFAMITLFCTRQLDRIERIGALGILVEACFLILRHGAQFFIIGYGYLFIAGILFYRIRKNGITRGRVAILAGCLAVSALAGLNNFIVMAILIGIFALLVSNRLVWMANRPLLFFGTISYTLYLVHQYIGYTIIRSCYQAGYSSVVAVSVATVSMIALATILTYTVEYPAMSCIRRFYSQRAKNAIANRSS